LVGKYGYGDVSSGYWTYNTATTDRWVDSGAAYAVAMWFMPNGTFVQHSAASASYLKGGGSYIVQTSNWHIPVKGTVRITNVVEDILYNNGTKKLNQYPGVKYDYKYTFTEKGIDYGLYDIYSTTAKSYEKVKD